MPVSASKARTSFFGSANDEWVTSTTVPPDLPASRRRTSALGGGSVPVSPPVRLQPARAERR